MGWSIDVGDNDLRAATEEDRRKVFALVNDDEWMGGHVKLGLPDHTEKIDGPGLPISLHDFVGDHWHEDEAQRVWRSLAPYMLDGSYIDFHDGTTTAWRVSWQGGTAYEAYSDYIVWCEKNEIEAPK